MLTPKKVKFRKWQRGRKNYAVMDKPETRGIKISFGSHGIKATSQARVTSNQIESARKVISRTIGKTGKLWIRIFPDMPITAKAANMGMGKGKGEPTGYCMDVRPGRVMFEVDGVTEEVAKEALRKAGTKLPVKTKIVAR